MSKLEKEIIIECLDEYIRTCQRLIGSKSPFREDIKITLVPTWKKKMDCAINLRKAMKAK